MPQDVKDIGKIVRQLRNRADMTRVQLAALSGVSPSHLTRVESGQRFPSARVLRKVAPHVGIGEVELLAFAGYLSLVHSDTASSHGDGRLDPYVVAYLSREPVELQRAVISIFSALKYMAEGIASEESPGDNGDHHIHDNDRH